jgi:hypothetical protein
MTSGSQSGAHLTSDVYRSLTPKKNIGVSLLPTIIVEEVLEFRIRKDISITAMSTVILKEASV